MKTQLSTAMKFRKTPKYITHDVTNYDRKLGSKQKVSIMLKKVETILELKFVTNNKRTEQKRFLTKSLKKVVSGILTLVSSTDN